MIHPGASTIMTQAFMNRQRNSCFLHWCLAGIDCVGFAICSTDYMQQIIVDLNSMLVKFMTLKWIFCFLLSLVWVFFLSISFQILLWCIIYSVAFICSKCSILVYTLHILWSIRCINRNEICIQAFSWMLGREWLCWFCHLQQRFYDFIGLTSALVYELVNSWS